MKRNSTLWLLLALLLTLSLVLVACGGDEEEVAEEEEMAEEEMAEPEEEAEEAEEEMEEEEMVEPVTVEVWFHSGKGEERDVLDAQVADFNGMQDEIFIDAVQLPEGSYNDQVSAGALAGDLPCLLDFDGPYLYNYAWSGYLRPMDDH
jgi:multiple sugar transport system substrate-binding protein